MTAPELLTIATELEAAALSEPARSRRGKYGTNSLRMLVAAMRLASKNDELDPTLVRGWSRFLRRNFGELASLADKLDATVAN